MAAINMFLMLNAPFDFPPGDAKAGPLVGTLLFVIAQSTPSLRARQCRPALRAELDFEPGHIYKLTAVLKEANRLKSDF